MSIYLQNKNENEHFALKRPLLETNSNLFRLANFANPSSFGKVVTICENELVDKVRFHVNLCLLGPARAF